MFNKASTDHSLKIAVLATLMLGGCIATTFPYMRSETAQRIAAPAWMIKRDVLATPFTLRAYERIHDRGGVVNLYIEGEGAAYTSPEEWESNPTPKNPIALHLASKDRADNVIYLARPCQYVETSSMKGICEEKYWKEARFSSEVIDGFNNALNDIAKRYDISGFNLIGYSGGGGIATLIAANRKDILSIRTVAGILDHETQSAEINAQPLSQSLNPSNEAASLTQMPQYHFIGGQDAIVPPSVLHSYLQSMPPTHCVQTMLVQEAGYEKGWVNKWPELLELPVTCYNGAHAERARQEIIQTEITPPKEQHFTTRPKPMKP